MIKIIYFDNAELCPPKKEVVKFVKKNTAKLYGLATKSNSIGSRAKAQIEQSRNTIANLFNVFASEIRFTSGGTESNNIACSYIKKENTKAIITSKFEHCSVLKTLGKKSNELDIPIYFVEYDTETGIDLKKLDKLLQKHNNSFVSFAHVNRLSGRLLQIKRISALCHKYNSVFHSDMSQTMGKLRINLQTTGIDIATFSAQNIGSIAGAGFIYFRKGIKLYAVFCGDKNEYNLSPGAENILSIAAMSLALHSEYKYFEKNKKHYLSLKKYLFETLDKTKIKYKQFSAAEEHFASYINLIHLSEVSDFDTLLIKLDLENIITGKIEKEQIDDKSYIQICFNSNNSKKEIKMFVNRLVKVI